MIDNLSLNRITYIIDCLDAFARSVSNKWSSFDYTFQPIVEITPERKLNKYIFTSQNHTDVDLEGKNQKFITNIR